MYKITGVDIKNNRYRVLDTGSGIEDICTLEQLLTAKKSGFTVYGVLPDGQAVVWDTFYQLSLLSESSRRNLLKLLRGYNTVVVTDDDMCSGEMEGNCVVFNISNRTSIEMFKYCTVKSLDLSNFDTSKVTSMMAMFQTFQAENLDLRNFDTSKVTNMGGMFYKCQVPYINLSGFDTSSVTDMWSMFSGCQVKSLNLDSFNTSNVTDMHEMFYKCQAVSLDLRNFDTLRVTDMDWMFKNYLGKEIILSEGQEKLINQAKRDGQEDKIRYV